MPPSWRASTAFPPSSAPQAPRRMLKDGVEVTVSCAEGETGRVYAGTLPIEVSTRRSAVAARPRTPIMVNLGNPDLAFKTAMRPNDGVGLARMEFIISDHIGIHPMALACPEKVDLGGRSRAHRATDAASRAAGRLLRRAAVGGHRHDRGGLLSQAGDRAAVRLQDQRVRQADRRRRFRARRKRIPCWASAAPRATPIPPMPPGFALECAALRRVREEMGLTNVRDHGAVLPAGRRGARASSMRWRATA